MGLTQTQRAIVAKAQSIGGGGQGVALDDDVCTYLVAVIAKDLNLSDQLGGIPADLPAFFGNEPLVTLRLRSESGFLDIFEQLVSLDANADTYFACLASLHKHRLKYERILQTQPLPTMDQVGARVLLQYGQLSPRALTGFLLWRKWMYDIDNRAAQETGYLFEPIIAYAIGGVPASAARSPVKRRSDRSKGRQVDCICGTKAYELKLRVTIAASGQGRWQEELDFPADCRASGYTPVLVVFDPTRNPKLEALQAAFRAADGEEYVGVAAWNHLERAAGATMAVFLERYVREPLQSLLDLHQEEVEDLSLSMTRETFTLSVGRETYSIERDTRSTSAGEASLLPEDADDEIPGP